MFSQSSGQAPRPVRLRPTFIRLSRKPAARPALAAERPIAAGIPAGAA